jgi:hypothetical protein
MKAGVIAVVLVCLAGCDNSPNPDFERQMTEQKAAKAGDPYQALNSVPQPSRYVRVETAARSASALQEMVGLRTTYISMLKKLKADEQVSAARQPVAGCMPVFDEALAFASAPQTDTGADTAAVKAAVTVLFDRLNACRDLAVTAGKSGDTSVLYAPALMRRFASAGMVLVSLSAISRGEEAAGLELWSRADRLVSEDKPGFQLTPGSFRPR